MKIDLIAGARPNFIKIAPIVEAILHEKLKGNDIDYRLIHTGQHYDKNMSESFFEELRIPAPHVNLNCGGGTQAEQTANIMVEFERDLIKYPADVVLVVGDVTSTMACSIVAKKLNVKVAHVEAGIRSFDWRMPEEVNRVLTDSISDYYFTTSNFANHNLNIIGCRGDNIFFTGNVMIDTLVKNRSRFIKPRVFEELNLKCGSYIVMTLHRPANVDEESRLKLLINEIIRCSNPLELIFPVHPRTEKVLSGLEFDHQRLHMIKPLGYLEFNFLVERAKAVITDSGGITEEASILNIPCMTLRDSTERPETIELGTNELLGTGPDGIAPAFKRLFSGEWKQCQYIPKWDGNAATRIIEVLLELFKEDNIKRV